MVANLPILTLSHARGVSHLEIKFENECMITSKQIANPGTFQCQTQEELLVSGLVESDMLEGGKH